MSRWNLAWLLGITASALIGISVTYSYPQQNRQHQNLKLLVDVLDEVQRKYVRELDQDIANRNGCTARAAAAAQDREAENRNVVVPADRRVAMRAVTSRKDQRLFTRVTMDDDVEKTADDRAESERVEGQQRRHQDRL